MGWRDFKAQFSSIWEQGQHVTILGATGSGKSTLEGELLSLRRFVVLLATKGEDEELSHFTRKHRFTRLTHWPPSAFDERIALWPSVENVTQYKSLGPIFYRAINGFRTQTRKHVQGIFQQGRWTVGLDEVLVLQKLGLQETLELLWTQGRSKKLSIVAGSQRPRKVPREMFTEPTHLFIFSCTDEDDIDRLSEIGGRHVKEIKRIVPTLEPFHFLYVNKRGNDIAIGKVER